ncbi:hypothetical protein DW322_07970 [Rhodococcus rhodnii]|uniref:Condensation domain-containing protein n=2 Tax=Rhodococcus rhodnii TaxID=38312 RepID=R7WKA7_9NOCA|nr:hypothetical protein [Rhodococcus rhodnii]EOM75751.1 hypothetical protein Rrhod_2917 [Rhodococcus rhodnii LMG 5362]TXG90168.1 hypothetical protein DW322_07970 [Rhodococcus rhodnii]
MGTEVPDSAARLGVVDEMFLRGHRGVTSSVVMQGLWRTDERVPSEVLAAVHERMARGRLGRRVVATRIPGARARFVRDTRAHPIRWFEVDRAHLTSWADQRAADDVDPERGPAWRMTVGLLDDGGTVVSIVCSHVVTDAQGLVAALAAAVRGDVPVPRAAGGVSDARDALRTWATVARGGARTARAAVTDRGTRRALRDAARSEHDVERYTTPTPARVLADLDAAAWDAVAAADGGTPNTLFVAVVADLARTGSESVTLSVPVGGGTGDRGNTLAMAQLSVAPGRPLHLLRDDLRRAYGAPPEGAPAGLPAEILHVLPDGLAARATRDAGERVALCSNIGTMPGELARVGGADARTIGCRAVHPHGVRETQRRTSAFLTRTGDRYTLAVESAVDDDHGALARRVVETLAARDLDADVW